MLSIDFTVIKTIPSETFWFLLAIISLFFLYFFYRSYKALIKARTMIDTPTSKIRSAAQGYVELNGTQRCISHQKIVAPLTKQPCTWYRYAIEQYRNKKWVIIDSGVSEALFELVDPTGSCIVDPKGAQVELSQLDCWSGFRPRPNGKPQSLLGRFFSLFGSYRYHEWRMEEEMPLHATGYFRTFTPSEPEFTQYALTTDLGASVNLLSGEGLSSRTPFILSAIDEQSTIKAYKREAFIWFLAYLSLVAGVIWLLMMRLG